MMPKETEERSNPALAAFTDDDLSPHLRGRVKALVHDLANNDLPMALLDLAHLYRALATGPRRPTMFDTELAADDPVHTVIYNDDRSAIADICEGPDRHGGCPRAEEGGRAACAGQWISAKGWDFKVAPDAVGCPLAALGVVRRYLQATVAGEP